MEYNEKERKLSGITLQGAVVYQLVNYNTTRDKNHSLQYSLEDALVAGLTAKERSFKYSEETQNRKKFQGEIEKDPTVVLDLTRMQALLRKYKMGGIDARPTETSAAATTAPPAQKSA